MSYFRATAIQRLGLPLPGWPDIYGSDATQSAAAQAITLDLTPHLLPVPQLSQELEQYLLSVSFGELKLDLWDPDKSLLATLGPGGIFDLLDGGYFGPWIKIEEVWDSGNSTATRFVGYVDETSIEWTEDEGGRLQASAYPVIQAVSARNLADDAALKRPFPAVASTTTSTYTQSTADALMVAAATAMGSNIVTTDIPTESPTALADEQALWASCKLSWCVWISAVMRPVLNGGNNEVIGHTYDTYPAPTPPSDVLMVGPHAYSVVLAEDVGSYDQHIQFLGETIVYDTIVLRQLTLSPLNGAPLNLADAGLAVGATVTWGAGSETRRSHFSLVANVPAPVEGSDGQDWMSLDSVDTLAPGDSYTVVSKDATTNKPRRTTDTYKVRDLDGELNRVIVMEPINKLVSTTLVTKIRRVDVDPVYVNALSFLARVISPLALDTTAFQAARLSRPVFSWLPMSGDAHGTTTYGAHNLQVISAASGSTAETLRMARRDVLWTGNFGGWTATRQTGGSAGLEILAGVAQWPANNNTTAALPLYVDNSTVESTPVNGWRSGWRSWSVLAPTATPTLPSKWDGTTATWGEWSPSTAANWTPARLVSYVATGRPGRYTRMAEGTWTYESHGTAWGSPAALGYSLPGGTWIALGMLPLPKLVSGTYVDSEGLVGLIQSGAGTHAILIDPSTGQVDAAHDYLLYGDAIPSVWSVGGGLICRSWTVEVDGLTYAASRLFLPDPIRHNADIGLDLIGVEVCPGTICARTIQPVGVITGYNSVPASKVSGWFALGIETYFDDNGSAARRLRFLDLRYIVRDGQPQIICVNGDLQPHLISPSINVRLGDIICGLPATGGVVAVMDRVGDGDRCVGLVGGRAFQVGYGLPVTLERVQLGDMTGQDALEAVGCALLATCVPRGDGSVALVSRQGGTLRTRAIGGLIGSWFDGEVIENPSETPVSRAYISEVDISYEDILEGSTEKIAVDSITSGGKPLDKDLSKVICTAPTARAVGTAIADHFGPIAPSITRTLREDIPGGVQAALAPPFWASWQVGDRVIADPVAPGTTTHAWKLTRIEPDFDGRTCAIQAVRLPIAEVIQ